MAGEALQQTLTHPIGPIGKPNQYCTVPCKSNPGRTDWNMIKCRKRGLGCSISPYAWVLMCMDVCRWHYVRPKASGKELLFVTKISILIYTVMMGTPICSLPALYWMFLSLLPAFPKMQAWRHTGCLVSKPLFKILGLTKAYLDAGHPQACEACIAHQHSRSAF